jgi:hypothetical protein
MRNRDSGASADISRSNRAACRRLSWVDSAGHWPKGGDPTMATQVTNKGGFANNFWLQTVVLLIVVAFLIAIAAKFVW